MDDRKFAKGRNGHLNIGAESLGHGLAEGSEVSKVGLQVAVGDVGWL